MPRKKEVIRVVDTENERKCLICSATTRHAHLEIDACRACTVFYRRSKSREQFTCRTGLHQCDLTRRGNFSCKRCRYDRFITVLRESKHPRYDGAQDTNNAPSTSSLTVNQKPALISECEREVFARLRQGYSVMNAIRRACELSLRSNLPDKKGIIVDGMVLIPATYNLLNQNTRIIISSLFEFASTSFEEFNSLEHDDKWFLIRNFYPFVMTLDSEYRMIKHLPENETMIFASYASYIDHDTIPIFFSDIPCDKHDSDRTRFLVDILDRDSPQNRAKMRRWNPTEDEFIAFLGLCFWSLDKVSVSDSVHRLAEKYRKSLFLELDKLYRTSLCLDDYAARMGEAVMFISSIQESAVDMRSKLGVVKICDDIWEEMIMTQLL